MKITAIEFDGCFSLDLEAESVEDVIFLVRFGLNKTKELRSAVSAFPRKGNASGHIVIGKLKQQVGAL